MVCVCMGAEMVKQINDLDVQRGVLIQTCCFFSIHITVFYMQLFFLLFLQKVYPCNGNGAPKEINECQHLEETVLLLLLWHKSNEILMLVYCIIVLFICLPVFCRLCSVSPPCRQQTLASAISPLLYLLWL